MLRRYRRICENEDKSLERLVKLICTNEKLFKLNYDIFYNGSIEYGENFNKLYRTDNIKDAIIEAVEFFREENKPICDGKFACYYLYLEDFTVYEGEPYLYTFYNESDMIKTLRNLYCKAKIWERYAECSPLEVNNFRKDIIGLSDFESFVDEI